MALEPPSGPIFGPRSWASVLPFMATGTSNISADSVCGWITDIDTFLGNSPGPDVIAALLLIMDHPDWHGPSGGMVPKCQHVPRWQPRKPLSLRCKQELWTLTQTLAAVEPQTQTCSMATVQTR